MCHIRSRQTRRPLDPRCINGLQHQHIMLAQPRDQELHHTWSHLPSSTLCLTIPWRKGTFPLYNASNRTLTCSLLRFKFQVMARGPSTEPAELKEWKPEHSWDYTIRIEGIKPQMGAQILINLNNPRDIPAGYLGLWFYMKKEGSDNSIEGPTCGACEKRQHTNVVRFKDAIISEQAHTRIICSPSVTSLEPSSDNTAYVADVSFLIWCPAYHEARSDHSLARVKQSRQHFQYVGFPMACPAR